MDAKQALFEKQFQRFKLQDPEEGFFDVVFEIDGKKLYADKFRLAAVSTTFQSMLSKNWNSKNEPIEIKGNNFEDFKEFLSFIYSGECNLTDENISKMIDIAEFYNVEILKNICDEYLAKMECTNENIFYLMETANKYSLIQIKQISSSFFVDNFAVLAASDKFLTLNGETIEELIISARDKVKPEEIFEAVYKWAEHQAEIKKAASKDIKNFNLNDAIKNELSELLPHIQFRKMKLEFLHKFVVIKGFIFPSLEELSDILCNCNPDVTVRVISPTGQFLEGKIQSNDAAVEIIKSLKNISATNDGYGIFWTPNYKIPSTPSQLKKREGVQWYLIYHSKYFGINHRSLITESGYLIAEMFRGTPVSESAGWKIEIF